MPHVEAAIRIRAPRSRVMGLYRNYSQWPRLFSATIRGVRLIKAEPPRTTLEIDHREGLVVNVMTEVSPERIDLWESKRRYNGTFVNRFRVTPDGTCYSVSADIELKGPVVLLGPLLGRLIRRQIVHYVLQPVRRRAEELGNGSPRHEHRPQWQGRGF